MFILDNKPFRDKYRIVLQRPVTEKVKKYT